MRDDFPLEMKKWLGDAAEGSAKKIAESGSFLAIFTDNYRQAAVPLLQMGIAIVMDKPIILIIPKEHWSTPIPHHLSKIATLVKRVDFDDEEAMNKVMAEVAEITKRGEV